MDKEFSGLTEQGATWLPLHEVKHSSSYRTTAAIKNRMREQGFNIEGIDFAYSTSRTNWMHHSGSDGFLIEIGTGLTDGAKQAIKTIESSIKNSNTFATQEDQTTASLAKHAFEAFFLLHEIGHANARRMEFLNSGRIRSHETKSSLVDRIYDESYADAFAISYMRKLNLNEELVTATGRAVETMRRHDEEVMTRTLFDKNGTPSWMSSKDFEHHTGRSITDALNIQGVDAMPPDILQQKIKGIALDSASHAMSKPAVAHYDNKDGIHHHKSFLSLEKLPDTCILNGPPPVNFSSRRGFLNCPDETSRPPTPKQSR